MNRDLLFARFALAALAVLVVVVSLVVACGRASRQNLAGKTSLADASAQPEQLSPAQSTDAGFTQVDVSKGITPTAHGASPQSSNSIPQEEIDRLDESLRIVAEFPVPAGQDADEFEKLRFALAQQLFANAVSRAVSKPATGEAGTVKDLRYEDNMIQWTYANTGDYDENGEVSVADIAVIARNFGAVVGDGEGDDALEAWIDGNGDGEVTIADITPIAENFLSRVDRYRLFRKSTLESNPIKVMDVPFSSALDTHPRTFAIWRDATPESQWKHWPFLFASVIPIDEQSKPGDACDYVQMNTIEPRLTRPNIVAGVTGRIGLAKAHIYYNIITPEPPVETFEWDFGGGAVPNTATGPEIRVTFAAPGSYVGTLTATSQYGTFIEKFPVVSKLVLRTGHELLWLDAYNLPYYPDESSDSSDLVIDVYAIGFDKDEFANSELSILFEGVDRSPPHDTYYGLPDNPSSGYRFTGYESGYSNGKQFGNQYLLESTMMSESYHGFVGTCGLVGAFRLMPVTFPAMKPSQVILRSFGNVKDGDFSATKVWQNFDGWFDWKTYDPEYDAPHGGNIGHMRRITPDVEYTPGVGVRIAFKAGIDADYNGDNFVDLMDINIIRARYLEVVDDGVLDEYDFQCDGDGSGEVSTPDITPIVQNYRSSASGFRLKRDGVTIAQYEVPCPRLRDNVLMNLWPAIEYIDADVPLGEHEYWVCTYDPLTGDEGDPSNSASVTVE